MDNRPAGDWLDTETKACLQQLPPSKLAPADTDTFSLVVLRRHPQTDPRRQAAAFERVLQTTLGDAKHLTTAPPPFILKHGLSLSDALLGQFELICCDIVSVFLADEVVAHAEPQYLADLYHDLLDSDEFATVSIRIIAIPSSAESDAFVKRFIGDAPLSLPCQMYVTRKKSRIMRHWARKLGGMVVQED